MNKRRPSRDLTAIIIYAMALSFVFFYFVWRTSDATWGAGGNFSYAFPPHVRKLAAGIAGGLIALKLAQVLRRYFQSRPSA